MVKALKHARGLEALSWVASLGVFAFIFKNFLFSSYPPIIHDNLYWAYPVFDFLADSISKGSFPLWNPLTHAGEPFYPLLVQMRFFEPLVLAVIALGKPWAANNEQLSTGFALRSSFFQHRSLPFFTYPDGAALAPSLLGAHSSFWFSNFCFVTSGRFREHLPLGSLDGLASAKDFFGPWAGPSKASRRVWLALGVSVGCNSMSYFFVGTSFFLFFYLLALVFFFRNNLLAVVQDRTQRKFATFAGAIVLLMGAPNISMLLSRSDLVYPARMVPKEVAEGKVVLGGPYQYELDKEGIQFPIKLPYTVAAATGTHSTILDFLVMPFAQISKMATAFWRRGLSPGASESFMFVGAIAWFFALWALFLSGSEQTHVAAHREFSAALSLGSQIGLDRVFHLFFHRSGLFGMCI